MCHIVYRTFSGSSLPPNGFQDHVTWSRPYFVISIYFVEYYSQVLDFTKDNNGDRDNWYNSSSDTDSGLFNLV